MSPFFVFISIFVSNIIWHSASDLRPGTPTPTKAGYQGKISCGMSKTSSFSKLVNEHSYDFSDETSTTQETLFTFSTCYTPALSATQIANTALSIQYFDGIGWVSSNNGICNNGAPSSGGSCTSCKIDSQLQESWSNVPIPAMSSGRLAHIIVQQSNQITSSTGSYRLTIQCLSNPSNPTPSPSGAITVNPTLYPSANPTSSTPTSMQPTMVPSKAPSTTYSPSTSLLPTRNPTIYIAPTASPTTTMLPSQATSTTYMPSTFHPTTDPTDYDSTTTTTTTMTPSLFSPTADPSYFGTSWPTNDPSELPTMNPSSLSPSSSSSTMNPTSINDNLSNSPSVSQTTKPTNAIIPTTLSSGNSIETTEDSTGVNEPSTILGVNNDYVLLIIIGCSCCCVCLWILLFIFYKKQKKQKQEGNNTKGAALQRVKSDTPITPISPNVTMKETEMEPMNDQITLNITNGNDEDELEESGGDGSEGDDMYSPNGTNVTRRNFGDADDQIPRLPTEVVNEDDDLLNEDENVIVDMVTPQATNEGNDNSNESDDDDDNDGIYDKPSKPTKTGSSL